MSLHQSPRIVLIDLQSPSDSDSAPARVPCFISSDELAQVRAFAAGELAECSVVLAFRERELHDLGVATVSPNDVVTGLFDTSGAPFTTVTDALHLVAVDTVRLARPGRHLLCAHFRSSALPAGAIAHPAQIAELTA